MPGLFHEWVFHCRTRRLSARRVALDADLLDRHKRAAIHARAWRAPLGRFPMAGLFAAVNRFVVSFPVGGSWKCIGKWLGTSTTPHPRWSLAMGGCNTT